MFLLSTRTCLAVATQPAAAMTASRIDVFFSVRITSCRSAASGAHSVSNQLASACADRRLQRPVRQRATPLPPLRAAKCASYLVLHF